MSFSQKTWKDRDVQYPGKRTLTNIEDNSDFQDVIVERAEGTVEVGKEGDLYCASVMNELEQRIANMFSPIFSAISDELDLIYPVGAIYQSMDNTSPSVLFPGTTWESMKGRLLLPVAPSQSSLQPVGNNSSELTFNGWTTKSVTVSGTVSKTALSAKQLPPHRHYYAASIYQSGNNYTYGYNETGHYTVSYSPAAQSYSESQGKGYGHDHGVSGNGAFTESKITINISQPYITMYAWRRLT